jgi:hypothetical protein
MPFSRKSSKKIDAGAVPVNALRNHRNVHDTSNISARNLLSVRADLRMVTDKGE